MSTKANPGFPANGFTAELVEIEQTGKQGDGERQGARDRSAGVTAFLG